MGNNNKVHCVSRHFRLRGTCNVMVCDASSVPLEIDENDVVYPVQNDGNTVMSVLPLAIVLADQFASQYS